jgi:hypothetical protein
LLRPAVFQPVVAQFHAVRPKHVAGENPAGIVPVRFALRDHQHEMADVLGVARVVERFPIPRAGVVDVHLKLAHRGVAADL